MDGLALLLSYLLGSITVGLYLGLWIKKIDIRERGSRNVGATNTMRVLGKKLGAAALIGDMLKGIIPVLVFARLGAYPYLPLACGVAAIVGHLFPIFIKFKGGKGVATATGVFLALSPLPTLAAAVVFGVTVYFSRMVSLGSMLAAITLTAGVWIATDHLPLQVVTTVVALLVIVKHRTNIQRILQGNENKI
jgi:glycerol-3-phosphate acyltransferase PlsY